MLGIPYGETTNNFNRKKIQPFESDLNFSDIQKRLIFDPEYVNAKDEYGDPLVLAAAYCGTIPILKLLLENGANIEDPDHLGNTPVLAAAMTGEKEALKFLLTKKANFKHKNKFGGDALTLAIYHEKFDTAKYLIEYAGSSIEVASNAGNTPLLLAVAQSSSKGNSKKESVNFIKYLVDECKVDLNKTNNSGNNALHISVIAGNHELVRYFFEEKQLSLFAKNNEGNTPLDIAEEMAKKCATPNSQEIENYLKKKQLGASIFNGSGFFAKLANVLNFFYANTYGNN